MSWLSSEASASSPHESRDVKEPRALLERLFKAAIDAAQPALCLPPHRPAPPKGHTIIVGAGKASAAMAKVLKDHWPGPLSGIVVTRYGYAARCRNIEIIEAALPPASRPHIEFSRPCGAERGIPSGVPHLGGWSSLLVAPIGGPCTAPVWRQHQRNELRAPASLGHQGWKACGGVSSGEGNNPSDLGCSR